MNWYIQYKESMALPEVKNHYPYESFKPEGLKYLDERLTPEKAENLLKEKEVEYLGSGGRGVAYGLGDKTVAKFTKDRDEAKTAKIIMTKQKGGKPLPGMVYVYNVEDISDQIIKKSFDEILYRVTIEKVSPLTEEQKTLFSHKYGLIESIMREDPKISNEKVIERLWTKFSEQEEFFIDILINFIRIIETNYLDTDIYTENVGLRNGNEMVVLDLGSVEFK